VYANGLKTVEKSDGLFAMKIQFRWTEGNENLCNICSYSSLALSGLV
jgi:hypothetical protein